MSRREPEDEAWEHGEGKPPIAVRIFAAVIVCLIALAIVLGALL